MVDPDTASVPMMDTEPEVAPEEYLMREATKTATLLTTIDTDDVVPVVVLTNVLFPTVLVMATGGEANKPVAAESPLLPVPVENAYPALYDEAALVEVVVPTVKPAGAYS